jgi:uncharacterized alkaline shock family protein YloU
MLVREKNDLGVITVNSITLDQLIAHALEPYKGSVWLANYKGPSSETLIKVGGYEAIAERNFRMNGDRLYVRLYLLISFGKSIRSICREIIDQLASDIEQCLQIPLHDIEIVVTGVVSKKIAPRHIVYSYRMFKSSDQFRKDEIQERDPA